MRWRSGSIERSTSSPTGRSGTPRPQRVRSSRRSPPTRPPPARSTSIFFGNESADSGGFQIGLRTALCARPTLRDRAQGRRRRGWRRPLRAGDRSRPRRLRVASPGGRDRARGAQSAAVPVCARPDARGAQASRGDDSAAARIASRAPAARRPGRRCQAGRGPRPWPRGGGRRRRPPASRSEWRREPRPRRARRRRRHRRLPAGAHAGSRVGGRDPCSADRAGRGGGGAAVPAAVVHVAEHDALDAFAPDAWAAIVCETAERIGATAIVAPGSAPATDVDGTGGRSPRRAAGGELHRGDAGRSARADPHPLGRQPARGGEPARRAGPRSPSLRIPSPRRAGTPGSVEPFTPGLTEADLIVGFAIASRRPPEESRWPTPRWWSRAAGARARPRASP